MAVEVQVAHQVSGRVAEVFVKALELAIAPDDAVPFVSKGHDFVKHPSKVLLVLHPKRIANFANIRLKVNLNGAVFAEMSDQVRQSPVVLLHDRRLDDDAHA